MYEIRSEEIASVFHLKSHDIYAFSDISERVEKRQFLRVESEFVDVVCVKNGVENIRVEKIFEFILVLRNSLEFEGGRQDGRERNKDLFYLGY
jgi:hypothetical protein